MRRRATRPPERLDFLMSVDNAISMLGAEFGPALLTAVTFGQLQSIPADDGTPLVGYLDALIFCGKRRREAMS